MKIVMTVKTLNYGGAYKIFMWLASALAEHGNEVIVFTYMPCDVKVLPKSIRWIRQDFEHAGFYARYKAYRQIVREYAPDCSISFLLDANVLNILACLNMSTKSVVCERNDPYKPRYYKLKLVKPLFRFADGAVFQLEKVKEYYSMIKSPTAVIPNPVAGNPCCPLKPFPEREDIIVTLGRLDLFQKRQDILLEAFHMFRKVYPHFKLVIYGNGKDRPAIEKMIARLYLQENVILADVTDTPYEAMKNVKFFVLTSDFEGIPNALIEAMSIGLPCISTDCSPGGASLLIEDKVNGFLIPRNAPEILCERMLYIMNNQDQMDRIENNAKKITEKFSESNIISKWSNYLKELCHK